LIFTKEVPLEYSTLNISPNDISKIIGYKEGEISEMVNNEINNFLREIGDHCDLKGGYQITEKVRFTKDSVHIKNLVLNTGKIITGFIKKSDCIVIMVCTAGERLNHWVNQLFQENNSLKAYIIDITASILVEKAANQVHLTIEKEAERANLKATNRYSPGYCDWSIKEQFKLFSLLPENFCNIRLNIEALMIPTKSVSAIIGLGKFVEKKDYLCDVCTQNDCRFKSS
jgi:hypothetical protein